MNLLTNVFVNNLRERGLSFLNVCVFLVCRVMSFWTVLYLDHLSVTIIKRAVQKQQYGTVDCKYFHI